ncbi:rhodanese-related sulfurtransferase [Thermocatellispora tengchongensis]|uniref:Rhodanese-related sulfurtransferase n=1 Tax=Thermocatellispora tengchongensis TaxID=1073253 RepID=A0A840PEY7_9ACTN|nr:rhodanese-like domain-containing protein [Thermocatellispora tengchongensis]MBB5135717.1 rhodanese-related sulfurtransferase [Thermocatellispora tengchongensis]
MVNVIDREGVRRLLATSRARLVEVLPEKEYAWAHLPGAVNLPLRSLDEAAAGTLDPAEPVVVYCHDLVCDMSPRAAHRLEHLGFPDVADYAAGKMDWISSDLPYEGEADLVGPHTRRDPVTARLDDPIGQVGDRIVADPAGLCVVVDEHDVVQGTIGPRELAGTDGAATAGEAMRFGVHTVRPSEELASLLQRLDRAGSDHVVVTRTDGTLVGLLVVGALRGAPGWEPDLG